MTLAALPSVCVVHLPDGEDLILRNRVNWAKGKYGRKLGSTQFTAGDASISLSNYDNLIDPSGGGQLSADALEQSSVSVGIAGHTLFSGRVRHVQVIAGERRTDVLIEAHDTLSEFAGGQTVDLSARPSEPVGNRINALLDRIGWGTTGAYRQVDDGTVYCDPLAAEATIGREGRVLDLLQQAADTEHGRLGVAHGRPMRDRIYNRGLFFFHARTPPPEPWVSIDAVSEQLPPDGLRPSQPVEVVPGDKTELINRVRFVTAAGVEVVEADPESIALYGEQDYAPRQPILSSAWDARALARWLLTTYSTPRPAVRQVKLAAYHYPEAVCRRAYRLSTDKTVQVITRQPRSETVETSIQRVDRVQFHLRAGDNPHGAVVDLTLDLQSPIPSAFWRYGVPGASELGETTVFAPAEPGVTGNLRADRPPDPYRWQEPTLITANRWNTSMINTLLGVYPTAADRDQHRPRPRLVAGRYQPPEGQMTAIAGDLTLHCWQADTAADLTLARVGPGRPAPGRFTLDDPHLGLLDAGNIIST